MTSLRLSFRRLIRQPGFTLVALTTLALGFGVNTAIFSVANAVVLRPLPYADAHRLVRIHQLPQRGAESVVDVMYLDFVDWRREVRQLEDLAAFASSSGGLLVEVGEQTETVEGKLVTWNLMSLLGVRPLLGRGFEASDDLPGAEPVVLLSEGYWRSRLGANPRAVGRTMQVNGKAHRIVGVLPAGTEYPVGARLWLPVVPALDPSFTETRSVGFLNLVGRLSPGVGAEQAATELSAVIDRVSNPLKPEGAATRATAVPFADTLFEGTGRPLLVLLAAAGLVFLIAGANIANLLIVRGLGRRQEMVVRHTLGARGGHLLAAAALDGSVLVLAGAAAGLALARWGLQAVLAICPVTLFRGDTIGIGGEAVLFAGALSGAVVLGIALLTGFQGLRLSQSGLIGAGEARLGRGPASRRWLDVFATAQLTLALVLLVGAGLLVRSWAHLQALEVGFDEEKVLTVAVALLSEDVADAAGAHRLFEELLLEVEALPGVSAAAGALRRPLESPLGFDASVTLEGRPVEEQPEYPHLNFVSVTPGYFKTLGVARRSGRVFTMADFEEAPPVAVLGDAAARRLFGDEDPVGRRLKWGPPESPGPWVEVVGTVGDVRSRRIDEVSLNVYVPFRQSQWPLRNVIVRSDVDPASLAPTLRRALRRVHPALRASELATTEELVSKAMVRPRFYTLLLGLFSALAVVIGAVGVYGVLAHSAALRRREHGIRLALGATPSGLVRRSLAHGLRLAGVAAPLGLLLSFLGQKVWTSLLFGVSASDPLTYVLTGLGLLGIALAACAVPAWRVSRVDPQRVLHSE